MRSRYLMALLTSFAAGVLYQYLNAPNEALAAGSRSQPYAFSPIYKVKFSAHGTQTIASDGLLVADTEDYDLGAGYDAVNSKFICPTAGRYLFVADSYMTMTTGGVTAGMFLSKNLSIVSKNLAASVPLASGYAINFQTTWALDLAVNDEVELTLVTGVGSLVGASATTQFQGFRLVE